MKGRGLHEGFESAPIKKDREASAWGGGEKGPPFHQLLAPLTKAKSQTWSVGRGEIQVGSR